MRATRRTAWLRAAARAARHLLCVFAAALTLSALLASCTATARITDAYMALDSQGDRKRDIFFTDSKEIHCIVEMGIGRKGSTVEVIIRETYSYDYPTNKYFESDRVFANAEVAPSPSDQKQKIDVELKPLTPELEETQDGPYPPGGYQCEAYLDGELQQRAIFNINFAPCPTSAIKPGSVCYGFYAKETNCPRYGNTSRDPLRCRCSPANGWECDQ